MKTLFVNTALLVAIWLVTLFVISRFGWSQFSRHFRDESRPESYDFIMVSGIVGNVPYNHCLKAKVDSEGLHLSVGAVWRPNHPPLFIPWKAFYQGRPVEIFGMRVQKFDVGRPQVGTLALPKNVFEEVSYPLERKSVE